MDIFELTGEGYLTDCNVRCRGRQPPHSQQSCGIYTVLIGGLEHDFYDFPFILGISSSQLTNSYFSEGLKPPISTVKRK